MRKPGHLRRRDVWQGGKDLNGWEERCGAVMVADYKDKEMSSFIIFPEGERGDKSKTGVYAC